MASISVNTAALAYHPKKWEDFVAKWSKYDDLSDRKIRRTMVEAALLSDFHTGPQLCLCQTLFQREGAASPRSQERVTRAVRTKSIHMNRVYVWVGISLDAGGGYHFFVNGMRSSTEPDTRRKLFYDLKSPKLAADKALGLLHSELDRLQEELMESQKEPEPSDSDDSSSE